MPTSSCVSVLPGFKLAVAALLGSLVGVAFDSIAPQAAKANMVQQIIIGKCSNAMQAEFNTAGKTPPAGMVDFTCGCVADGMLKRRQSLDQSKTTCVQMANQKYGTI